MKQIVANIFLVFFLLSSINAIGQNSSDSDLNILTYVSRKGVYQIKYNKDHWQKSNDSTKWDAEFHDNFKLLTAYFIEYDSFVPEKNLKSIIQDQYRGYGKVKNLKIYKKRINEMDGDYFECELPYNNSTYKFQGFMYNGKGGAMQIQFGVQAEGLKQYQEYINEFCNGINILK